MFTHSKTSKKSDLQMSLLPTSGREDSLARTSQWHAWARELGLKGKDRDSFLNLLDYLNNASPEFSSSRTFRAFSLPTEGGTSKSLSRTLASLGYGVGWRVLNSRYFGVPQSRQRVYVVGCYRDRRGPRTKYFLSPNAARGILCERPKWGETYFPL